MTDKYTPTRAEKAAYAKWQVKITDFAYAMHKQGIKAGDTLPEPLFSELRAIVQTAPKYAKTKPVYRDILQWYQAILDGVYRRDD